MTQTPSQAAMPCAVDLTVSEQPMDSIPKEELFTTVIAPCSDAEPQGPAAEEPSETPSGFAGFGFSEALLKTLEEKGYKDPHQSRKQPSPS